MIFKKNKKKVELIYQNIITISRSKVFYLDFNLDDRFETRFDLITFHAFAIFYFFRKKNIGKSEISQELFDLIFSDLENNLREMGFGDIAVNKKMKLFVNAFYGRIAQYSQGMEKFENLKDKSLLHQTILNNIYKGKNEADNIDVFVNYIISSIERFLKKTEEENLESCFQFKNLTGN